MISNKNSSMDTEIIRIRIYYILMLLCLAFLLVALMKEQVFSASQYRTSSERQSMRRIRIPGERGKIYDRNHICIADNRPCYNIVVYIEELRQPGKWTNTVNKVENVLNDVSKTVGLGRTVTRDDIMMHIRKRLALPFIAWQDVDQRTIARLLESGVEFQGVDIEVEAVRVYPYGRSACHLLGYVGRGKVQEKEEETYHFYIPEMDGKNGIEEQFNRVLAGESGGKLFRVDASGYKCAEETVKPATPGADLILTIDARIQQMAEQLLADQRGAAVMMDPRNGDVLALVSVPGFDPNAFSPTIDENEWKRLKYHEWKPLINRAISGVYPPGSIFKPIVAIAALKSGIEPGTTFGCPGYFQLGNIRFNCWQKTGHGSLDMRKGIEQSCNAYFCQLGMKVGWDAIYKVADTAGLGHKTDIDVPNESAGLLPNEEWKRARLRDGWRSGDTCNCSIGQGALLVTPLQMTVVACAIANGGKILKPRIIASGEDKGRVVENIHLSENEIGTVLNGMHDVIQADTGTGKRARISGVEMAGKTGTAEFGPKEARKKYTWMMCFAPFEDPRYAVIMLVEEGMSGGSTVAPRVQQLMQYVFDLEKKNQRAVTGSKDG